MLPAITFLFSLISSLLVYIYTERVKRPLKALAVERTVGLSTRLINAAASL